MGRTVQREARDPGRRGNHTEPAGRPKSMAKAGKKSDRLREKDAQHTPPACVCGMEQASSSVGRGQEACHASRGERTRKHEVGVELPEEP
ncbi:MAG: hypothetical protein ACK53Y_05915 [bacterium]